jgi:alpha-glucosidase
LSFSLKGLLRIIREHPPSMVLQSAVFPLRKWLCERQGAGGRCPRAADEPLAEITGYQVDGPVLSLAGSNGTLHLEVLAADVIRFHLARPGTSSAPFSYALDPDAAWPPAPFEVEDTNEAVILHTKAMAVRVDRAPCRLSFYDAAGRLLSGDGGGLGFRGEGAYCARALDEGEAVYGLGEKAFGLNLRGRAVEMWNTDPQSYAPGRDPIYQSIPFMIGLRDALAYGLFMDNPGRARFDLGCTRPEVLRYEADSGRLCGYFFCGPGMRGVLTAYTQLTGRMPLPPRWLLGYHQSRWSYYPESQVRELAAEFRRRRIPCDAIHLDIHHMDGYRIFTWDREGFPDPAALIAHLRGQGIRTVLIVDPGVKVDRGYALHDDGLARGAFCRLPNGKPFSAPVWPGLCYFPDFTDPKVRALAYNTISVSRDDEPEAFRKEHEAVLRAAGMK